MATQKSKNDSEEYYTFAEVQARFKISRTKLWRWRNNGLRTTIIDGVKRIRKSDLEDFVGE